METRTVAQAQTKIGGKLFLIGAGESLDADDGTIIEEAIDEVAADLAARSVIDIRVSEIPLEAFDWFCDCVADAVKPTFGQPRDANVRATAERALRTIASASRTYETLQAEYY